MPLTYNFTSPYAGGGQVEIINDGDTDVVLNSLAFVGNPNIQSFWGSLWAWGAKSIQTLNPDGVTYTYNITEPTSGVTIPANGSAQLSYGYQEVLGPLNAGMNPKTVNATVAGNTKPINVPIDQHCQGSDCDDPLPGRNLSGYYTDWDQYARQFDAKQIPVRWVNNIIYAFFKFDVGGNISLYDPNSDGKQIPNISQLRQKYPYLNAFLSLGGWTLSANFSPMAADPQAVDNFVSQVIKGMLEAGFNGVDIDWEYPTGKNPNDATNYANLLSKLRQGLDAQSQKDGTKYYLSIAAPAGVDKIDTIQQNDPNAWKQVEKAVDYVNIMSYDYHGAFDEKSDDMSAMNTPADDPNNNDPVLRQYNVNDTVNIYLNQLGFPSEKLIEGAPGYWRTEYVNDTVNNGRYRTITGTPPGQFDDTGVFDYRCVQDQECQSGKQMPADMQYFWEKDAQVPYGLSPSQKIFATGDNPKSIANKAQYANQNKLGGMMFWTISGSVTKNLQDDLINTAYQNLKSGDKNIKTVLQENPAYKGDIASNAALGAVGLYAGYKLGKKIINFFTRSKATSENETFHFENEQFIHYYESLKKEFNIVTQQHAYYKNKQLSEVDQRWIRHSVSNDLKEIAQQLRSFEHNQTMSKPDYEKTNEKLVELKNGLCELGRIPSPSPVKVRNTQKRTHEKRYTSWNSGAKPMPESTVNTEPLPNLPTSRLGK